MTSNSYGNILKMEEACKVKRGKGKAIPVTGREGP
jgi:hypothetical protein